MKIVAEYLPFPEFVNSMPGRKYTTVREDHTSYFHLMRGSQRLAKIFVGNSTSVHLEDGADSNDLEDIKGLIRLYEDYNGGDEVDLHYTYYPPFYYRPT